MPVMDRKPKRTVRSTRGAAGAPAPPDPAATQPERAPAPPDPPTIQPERAGGESLLASPRGGAVGSILEVSAAAALEIVPGYDRRIIDRAPIAARTLELASSAIAAAGVALPDAIFAGIPGSQVALATARSRETAPRVLELIIGTDDRVQVASTREYPWRCVCELRITAQDGSQWSGTGWLAGPRLVVTAGHVVYIHNRGGWARSIEVIPGVNGLDRPFGSALCDRFHCVSGWTAQQDGDFDYGAIVLPAASPYGQKLGYLGFATLEAPALEDAPVNIAGYPSDKPPGTLWYHARRLERIEPRLLYYNIDTAGGQSGAPAWAQAQGQRLVVGVHTGGAITGNSAVRIDPVVFDTLSAWIQSP